MTSPIFPLESVPDLKMGQIRPSRFLQNCSQLSRIPTCCLHHQDRQSAFSNQIRGIWKIRRIANPAGRTGAMPISQMSRPFSRSSCVIVLLPSQLTKNVYWRILVCGVRSGRPSAPNLPQHRTWSVLPRVKIESQSTIVILELRSLGKCLSQSPDAGASNGCEFQEFTPYSLLFTVLFGKKNRKS